MKIENKKIPLVLAIISILMLVYGLLTKDYKNRYYAKQKLNHLDAFDVSLFGLDFSYKNFILFFIILIGISIYLFLYVKDDIIKEKASNFIEFKKNNSENNIEKEHPVFHTSVDKEPLIFARLFAFFIDIFISISLISFIWGILYLPVWKGYLDNKSFLGMMAFTNPMVLIFRIIYFASFESSKWLGTPGKMLMGLKVVNEKGERINFWDGIGRNFFKILSIIPICLGFLPLLFKRKTLYDTIMVTNVIEVKADKNKEWKQSWLIILFSIVLLIITSKLPANTEAQGKLNSILKEYRQEKNN